jgi:serine/threonine-protein kinase
MVIAGGRETLSVWEPYYTNFLSLSQVEALKELVEKVIRWPIVTKTPELLAELIAQDEASPPPEPVPGKRLGRYIIEEPIGGGGMADVFKALDPDLNRLVAIKQMRAGLSKAEEFRARFLREAQAVATLRHPNIVQIYDFGLQDNHYYMVMEFIEGYNLKEYLDQLQAAGQTLPWMEGVSIAAQVAQALDYAHQRGMLHRDVKPTNILLTNEGGVFLADFGLVRLLGQTDLTQAGGIVGTLAYMAPEQIMGEKEEMDYRADIYALGCVVYEMITGQPLFEPTALLATHFETNLPSPGLLVSSLPEAASQVILKALAINPAERPSSASQFIEDLRQALKE